MKCDTIIFDMNHAAHRVSAATPPLNNSRGERTEVVFGLLRLLSSVLRSNPAKQCIIAWDGPGSRRIREKVDPEYKSHRGKDHDDGTKERITSMHEQIARFMDQFMVHLPIHSIISKKYEADDIIAMASRRFSEDGDVLIVSGDKDLLQVVSTKITVYSPFGNRYCTPENFREYTKGFPDAEAYLAAKCLMGDSSDNIKGIGGVGEITALKILEGCAFNLGMLKHVGSPGCPAKIAAALKTEETWKRISMNYALMSLQAPMHHKMSKHIDRVDGKLNTRLLQTNLAKNQFASLLATFTQWVSPFKLLEK